MMGLPPSIAVLLPENVIKRVLQTGALRELEEIRLTAGQPLLLIYGDREYLCADIVPRFNDLEQIMLRLTQRSLYAFERELASGFLTVAGGHRVGFCGTALDQGEHIRSQREISSVNIRLARSVYGCANELLRLLHPFEIWGRESLLILSPPGAGKTTLLRDLIKALSEARSPLTRGYKIGVVDERSELAAMQNGVALHELGPRTFVLNAAPKAQGLRLLLRSMSPQILATDELGDPEEWRTLMMLAQAGVSTLFTVHGASFADLEAQDAFQDVVDRAVLRTVVLLGRTPRPGVIREIWRRQEGRWSNLVAQMDRSGADSNRRFLGRREPTTAVGTAGTLVGGAAEVC